VRRVPPLSVRFVNSRVGERLRARRQGLRMSCAEIAEATGLTCDQVQRYEDGTGRISASRLWVLASVLEIPMGYFFEGLDAEEDVVSLSLAKDFAPVDDDELAEILEALPSACRARIADIAGEIAGGETRH
jgi:transcriptional regulator with XRE-family HTH domain